MRFIAVILQAYVLAIVARALLSWFPHRQGSPVASIQRFFYVITEPVLGPVRRLLPHARFGNVALDLSAVVVVLVIQIIVLPLLH